MSQPVWSQSSPNQNTANGSASSDGSGDDILQILVVGTRLAEQDAIARKKNADTAQDSIVAEDVGAFPDRNIVDAISRVAGISVDRGDMGEGFTFSLRGSPAEQVRVEMDGMAVQSAGGGNRLGNPDGSARAADLREMPSDLIKSVDVIKGSTADMTEGGLTGSVKITTRTGLDLKKGYTALRLSGNMGSIDKKFNPDVNLIHSNRFLNDKLGVLVNLTAINNTFTGHRINFGEVRREVDWDQSPEKTFSYRPELMNVNEPSATVPWNNINYRDGTPVGFNTPLDILKKSAAAQTKQDCYAAFPTLTSAQIGGIASNQQAAAANGRQLELLSCLNQWNDYLPSNPRYFATRSRDQRRSGSIRFDYKVDSNLSFYFNFNRNRTSVVEDQHEYQLGGPSINPGGNVTVGSYVGPAFLDTFPQTAIGADGTKGGMRTLVQGSGYYQYPGVNIAGVNGLLPGVVANIVPSSIQVDAKHHVTAFDIVNGDFNTRKLKWASVGNNTYMQAGGAYRNGRFKADFMLSDARGDFERVDHRIDYVTSLGLQRLRVTPSGIWTQEQATPFDLSKSPHLTYRLNPQGAIAPVPAPGTLNASPTLGYSSAQLPVMSNTFLVDTFNPRRNENYEKSSKLDMVHNVSGLVPFLNQIRVGGSRRDWGWTHWGGGGGVLQEPVGVPGAANYVPGIAAGYTRVRSTYQICQDTAGSLGPGGRPCRYGWNPSQNWLAFREGNMIISPDQYRQLYQATMVEDIGAQFFHGAQGRPSTILDNWVTPDVDKLIATLGLPHYNLDCLKRCVASDGKEYDQIVNRGKEKVTAGYAMTTFTVDRFPFTERALPFGMEFDGNFGYRMVRTEQGGSAVLRFFSTVRTPKYLENPTAPDAYSTRIYRRVTSLQSATTDYMPSFNLNTWLVPEKVVMRYNWGKNIARVPIDKLMPGGDCTYDERVVLVQEESGEGAPPLGCTGVMGNPDLKPFTNKNQNLALEWYVNKNFMVGATVFHHKVIIGAPNLQQNVTGERVFDGVDVFDPQSGRYLSDFAFNFRRWENFPGDTKRKGLELTVKSAFTFLPWKLRYTGLDFNTSKTKSSGSVVVVDPLTGAGLDTLREPKYWWNASLWYDDGKLSARVSMQVTAPKTWNVSTGGNVYQIAGVPGVRNPAYNPYFSEIIAMTRYVDAKATYRFKNGIEVFIDGRNLGKFSPNSYGGPGSEFADGTPVKYGMGYGGARYSAGITIRR